MEFAAMVRSVLKLSAGIQLALRSSLGRARLPLPAGTGTHRHVHSWQASPKTCEKPRDSWMLLSRDIFKRGKTEGGEKKKKRKTEHLFMCCKPRTFGATRKKFIQYAAQNIIYVCCVSCLPHLHMTQKAVGKKKKACCIPCVCHVVLYMLITSVFRVFKK